MNIKIYSSVFKPKEVKGNILVIHGMCEHKQRYESFAKFLAKKGFMVYTYDQVGHGTQLTKEELGYFDGGFSSLVEVAHNMCIEIRKENDAPLFLFAHSMGSIVARSLIKKYPSIIDGVILSGAPNYKKNVPLIRTILKMNYILFKEKTKNEKIFKIIGKIFNKKIENSETDFDWLSYNKENVVNFINDEYCGFPFTNKGYYDLLDGLYDTKDGYDVKNKQMPILFIAGKDDPVTGFEKGLNDSVNILKNAGYENVEIKVYDNSRHELLFEEVSEKVINDVEQWLSLKVNQEVY